MEMGEGDDSDYHVTCVCYRVWRESSEQARPGCLSRPRLKTSEEKHEPREHVARTPSTPDGPPHAAAEPTSRP